MGLGLGDRHLGLEVSLYVDNILIKVQKRLFVLHQLEDNGVPVKALVNKNVWFHGVLNDKRLYLLIILLGGFLARLLSRPLIGKDVFDNLSLREEVPPGLGCIRCYYTTQDCAFLKHLNMFGGVEQIRISCELSTFLNFLDLGVHCHEVDGC